MYRLVNEGATLCEADAMPRQGRSDSLFTLCLGALADATGYAPLDFVWCTNTLIPLFDADSHADAVTDTKAAPRRSDATLSASVSYSGRI